MRHILYLTYQENPFVGNKAIIKTQVEELLKVLSEEEDITWIMIYNEKLGISASDVAKYEEDLKKNKIRFVAIECGYSNIYTAFFNLKRIIKNYLSENATEIIHCRGYAMTLMANLVKTNEKVIFDMRGVEPQENRLNKRFPANYINYFFFSLMEFYNVRRSESIIAVTDYFKSYIVSKHGCGEEKVKVIHCCVNTEKIRFSSEWRDRIREELGCKDSKIVVFSGSIKDKWQSFDKIAKLYITLSQQLGNAKFILLTRDKDMDFSLYGLDPANVMVRYVDNSDVYKYLSASDIALLTRNESIINAVAFPVKFAEYMACGVPTVINESMKGLVGIIEGKGIVYKGEQEAFDELLSIKRESCMEFSRKWLDTKVVAGIYHKLYRELLPNKM